MTCPRNSCITCFPEGETASSLITYPIENKYVDDCNPQCNKYYHSRMPKVYEYIDIGICLLYLVNYCIVIYISQNRC